MRYAIICCKINVSERIWSYGSVPGQERITGPSTASAILTALTFSLTS